MVRGVYEHLNREEGTEEKAGLGGMVNKGGEKMVQCPKRVH